jgi:hypothetical protein
MTPYDHFYTGSGPCPGAIFRGYHNFSAEFDEIGLGVVLVDFRLFRISGPDSMITEEFFVHVLPE